MALRLMRENIRKFHWVLWIVIASFVLVYGYDFVQRRESPQAQPVLKVNGTPVPLIEVQRSLQAMSRFFQNQQPEQRKLLVNMILDSLIDQILLNQLADQLQVVVSDEEVNQVLRNQIASLKDSVRKQNPKLPDDELDRQVQAYLKSALTQQGYASLVDYRQEIARSLRAQKVQELLGAPVTVSDAEIREAYEREYVTAKLEYVMVKVDRYKAPKPKEEELKAFYQAHRDRYKDKEKRRVEIYRVPVKAFLPSVTVTPKEIEAYYQDHKDEFTEPPRVHARHILISTSERSPEEAYKRAQEVLKKLHEGADFAQLAAEYSDDPGSRTQGGDLGWFTRGRMVKTFEDACFAARVGAVVGPIQTEFGYHIIEVLEKDPGGLKPLEAVRDTIREKLARPKALEMAETKARELRKALQSGKSIDDFIKAGWVVQEESPLFDADTSSVPATIRQAAFQIKKVGEYSSLIALSDGYAILRIREIRTPLPMAYKAARESVLRDWQRAKKLDLAEKDARELLQIAHQNNEDLKSAAEQLGLDLETAGPISRKDRLAVLPVSSDFTAKLWDQPVAHVLGPVSLDEQGYLVYKITERHDFDEKDLKKKEYQIRLKLIAQKRGLILQNIIKQLKAKAKIQRNEQLIRDLTS